jgi:CRP-like cAMP-binding protein
MIDSTFLSTVYLLRGATQGDIDAVNIISEAREFKAGEQIVTEQDKSRDIMVIGAGKARVETRGGDLIGELKVGDMIGEIAFLDGKERTANVSAIGKCTIFVVPEKGLRELMRTNPKLEVTVLRNATLALCQRLRDANKQVESLMVAR